MDVLARDVYAIGWMPVLDFGGICVGLDCFFFPCFFRSSLNVFSATGESFIKYFLFILLMCTAGAFSHKPRQTVDLQLDMDLGGRDEEARFAAEIGREKMTCP